MQPRCQATLKQPLHCVLQHHVANLHVFTHVATSDRQSCSHSKAICNHRFKKRIELRTQEQPLVAKHIKGTTATAAATAAHTRYLSSPATTHIGTTTRCKTHRRNHNDRSRNRRTHEVPFIAGCSHFTRKNARFRAPASSPKHSPCMPMQHSCSHSNAICNHSFKTRIELRT